MRLSKMLAGIASRERQSAMKLHAHGGVTMKVSNTMFATALIASSVALLAVQTAMARGARSLGQVESIWVDSNACLDGIGDQLAANGYYVTDSRRTADAILEVDVRDRGSEVGEAASYTARLHGDGDRVLFSASGRESAVSRAGLCDDIGDNIADGMDELS
jgi:hypothetical protein